MAVFGVKQNRPNVMISGREIGPQSSGLFNLG